MLFYCMKVIRYCLCMCQNKGKNRYSYVEKTIMKHIVE